MPPEKPQIAAESLEDDDPDMTRMALYRLAVAEKREPGETEAAVRAYRDARLSGPVSRPVSDDSGQATSAAQPQPREHAGADVRERLGRLVHQERLDAEAERAEAEGRRRFLLEPWGERTEWQRELDMRIGHAIANYALTENAITWGTSCTSCARVLDSAVAERERAERAEAKLAAIEALCREDRGDPCWPHMVKGILAILGTEGEASRPKLVRDLIPALIRSRGMEPVTRTASAWEMPALLRDKLREETGEYLASGDPAELADILEVLHALAGLRGIGAGELERMRAAKAGERGTFAGRVVWAGNRELGTGEGSS